MRRYLAPILSRLPGLVLIMVLVFSSLGHAMAHGSGNAAFWTEICSDGGITLVGMDENGNPVGTHAPCPECLPAALADGPAKSPSFAAPGRSRTLDHRPADQVAARLPILALVARGPPALA